MQNFVVEISIKFRWFLLNQDEFVSNCCSKHSKISVEIHISADIQKVKYRRCTDISVGLYIGSVKQGRSQPPNRMLLRTATN